MNRAMFLKNLTFFSGLIFGGAGMGIKEKRKFPKTLSENIYDPPVRKGTWDGFDPKILDAPWGQKVFYDQHTYTDFQRAKWQIDGLLNDKLKHQALICRRNLKVAS
jgi:hypothetical protein